MPGNAERAAAVVLAAGEATRFVGPKLTMPFGGSTVIGCVVNALEGAGVAPIIVVAGANRAEIEEALSGSPARIIANPEPVRGMLSSVRVGVAALPPDTVRFVIALGDQPRITTGDISRLLAEQRASGKGIGRPVHRGKRGHPVVFAGRYRDEVLSLAPEATLREVIHRHLDDVVEVEFASDAFIRDIDTQEQYEDERRKAGADAQGTAGFSLPPSSNRGIFAEIVRLQQAGRRAVLATPLWYSGSVPLVAESKLLLRDDGTMVGTIGGGLLEAQVIEAAQHLLDSGQSRILEFELTADQAARAGMICGGRCAVLVEPIEPGRDETVYAAVADAVESHEPALVVTLLHSQDGTTKIAFVGGDPASDTVLSDSSTLRTIAQETLKAGRPRFIEQPVCAHFDPILPHPTAFIFGAGHVAIPVAHIASLVGFRVVVIDDRAEFANRERFPNADEVMVAPVQDAFRTLSIDETAYVIAITRGHALDEDVVANAVTTPARYIGMIGSKRKVAGVLGRLRERGFTDADLARLHAPIGVDINAETVEEIAVSIVAELIAVRRGET